MRTGFRRHLLPLLAAGIVACGESSPADNPVRVDSLPGGIPRTMSAAPVERGRWRLVHLRDIQPPELDSAELIAPGDLALADDGSLLVAEGRPTNVKVYRPDGTFLRAIGREGSGPGEFRSAYIAVRGDTLVVQDAVNVRATSWNWRTGTLLTERRTTCCYFFPMGIDAHGRAAVRAMRPARDSTPGTPQAFVQFLINGSSADTIIVVTGHQPAETKPWLIREGNQVRMATAVPLQPRAYHVVDPSGGFVTAYSTEYMLRRTRNGRDTVALFGREWTTTPVTAADKNELVERRIDELRQGSARDVAEATLRASFDASSIPDTRPAFDGVWVDAVGRTWVRASAADTSVVNFDLFDRDGRWLDVLEVPASGWPSSVWATPALGRETAAVVLEGEDGRPLVRIYRLERR